MNLYPPGALIAGQYEVASRPLMGGSPWALTRLPSSTVALEHLETRTRRPRHVRGFLANVVGIIGIWFHFAKKEQQND